MICIFLIIISDTEYILASLVYRVQSTPPWPDKRMLGIVNCYMPLYFNPVRRLFAKSVITLWHLWSDFQQVIPVRWFVPKQIGVYNFQHFPFHALPCTIRYYISAPINAFQSHIWLAYITSICTDMLHMMLSNMFRTSLLTACWIVTPDHYSLKPKEVPIWQVTSIHL